MGNHRYLFNNLISVGGKYIYGENVESSKYRTLCDKMVEKLLRDVTLVIGLMLGSFGLYGLGVLYDIVVNHSRATFLSTVLPFFEKDSNIGYALNLSIQGAMICAGLLAMVTIEIGACLVVNAALAIPEIIHLDADELETELNLNGMNLIAQLRLRNIIMQVIDFYG